LLSSTVGQVTAGELTVASFNTRGVPLAGSQLAIRYAVAGALLDAGDADVVCVQEVLTWWHLRLLARPMRSFPHVVYRRSLPGPAGGLVMFSRLPVSAVTYRGFGIPPKAAGISGLTRARAGLKGALAVRLEQAGVAVVNTHPIANRDGDWSRSGRFWPVHRAQLDALTATLRGITAPAVVCGDFNIDRDSSLMGGFLDDTGLCDAFGGGCPPTFRAEYLPAGETPHCIDFILTTGDIKAVAAEVLFADKEPLPGGPGYLSDHVGLSARLSLTS
jgi:sphingomyelin phosphodiesterase 2